jgi:DNA-binding MarR family transcriptional regulator
MLWWIGRFRFVTARELSARFAVTEQRVNARVRRLLSAGLIDEMRPHNNASRVVFLTRRGARTLGIKERRPPRTDVQRRHELALAMLVAQLERGTPAGAPRLMTERECRRAERRDRTRRWSVDVTYRAGAQKRWPDLVECDGNRRRAIEAELAVKHTARLEAIVEAYRYSDTFDEVIWLVESPSLCDRLERMVEGLPRIGWLNRHLPLTEMRVVPYTPGREPAIAALIAG